MLGKRTALVDATTERAGTSPVRFEVTLRLGDDRLSLVVDRDGTILDHDRHGSDAAE